MSDTQAMPLSRFKVLDLTRVRAGPTAVRQLADWGADVIKIEAPADARRRLGGPRHGPDFQNLHRNKRSLTLDLKSAEGIEIFRKLVRGADVLVENYRPDVKTRLGIDYAALKPLNPRLVYASISGFGQSGPYRDRAGFDQIAQGMGGLMSITGLPGQGPVRVGIPVADLSAGIFCAMGILVALLEREVSGEGQWVESSLLAAQIAMLDFQAARWLIAHEVPEQAGNDHPTTIPTGVFKTRDGHINIASAGDEIFGRLCRALDAPELAEHPDYRTGRLRSQNRKALNAAIEAITVAARQRRMDRAVEQGRRAGGPDLCDGPGVRRSAGAAPRHRAAGRAPDARPTRTGRPGGDLEPHAEPAEHRQPRSGRAYRHDPARTWLQRGRHRRAARAACDLSLRSCRCR